MSSSLSVPHPAADANKYSRGKLVVVAGSARYPGAAVLAACAAERVGAGYTEVVASKPAVALVRAASPAIVARPFGTWDAAELPASSPERPCAVCAGPGFQDDDWSADVVARILKKAKCPVVVDGGGLARLGSAKALKRLVKREERGLPTVITPHGGEAARLAVPFGLPTDDPAQLADGLALALHAIVVLKGPDTHVSDGKRSRIMGEGTPALAKAGTGDVLAGIIGALLAQGVDAFEAAFSGAALHARAAASAASRLTDIAVTPTDVIAAIPDVLKES